MSDRTTEGVKDLLLTHFPDSSVTLTFLSRLNDEAPTRDENPFDHFCIYFAAYDPDKKLIYLGHHKKSGLWLFNGGHIDRNETPSDALNREIREEWGSGVPDESVSPPKLLTITDISPESKYPCHKHFEIWYFIKTDSSEFHPLQPLIDKEFFKTSWLTLQEARAVVTDPNTMTAIGYIEQEMFR